MFPHDALYRQTEYLADQITRLEAEMIDPQEFGRMQGAVAALKSEVDQIRDKQTRMDVKLDLVLEKLSEAKGGWRLLMLLGGAGASLGAIVSWIIAHNITIGPK